MKRHEPLTPTHHATARMSSISHRFAQWFTNGHDPRSPASRMRARRIAPLLAMVREVWRQQGRVDIIDIGGTRRYWHIVDDGFLARHNVTITLLNKPGAAVQGPGLPASAMDAAVSGAHFRRVIGDGCDLRGIADRSFDIAHANSVIEHVGSWPQMVRFANEVMRVAPRHFVQTPNFWFPIEPHCMTPFFHWLPLPLRIWLVMHCQLGHWPRASSLSEAMHTEEDARLLTRGMLQALFPDSQVLTERVLGFWPKSFVALRSRAAEAPLPP